MTLVKVCLVQYKPLDGLSNYEYLRYRQNNLKVIVGKRARKSPMLLIKWNWKETSIVMSYLGEDAFSPLKKDSYTTFMELIKVLLW